MTFDRDVAHMAARRGVREPIVVIDEIAPKRRLVVAPNAPRFLALQAIDVQNARFAEACGERGVRGVAQLFPGRPHESTA
jgi:hypothetical protein